jgi:hypothetical protein
MNVESVSTEEWKTTVTINDPERATFWQAAIGTVTLPVKNSGGGDDWWADGEDDDDGDDE